MTKIESIEEGCQKDCKVITIITSQPFQYPPSILYGLVITYQSW